MNVDKSAFTQALGALALVVPNRSPNPIQTYCWMGLAQERLLLRACNGSTDLEVAVPVEGTPNTNWSEPLLLPFQVFSQYVGALSGPTLELVRSTNLKVRSGTSEGAFSSSSVEGFPEFPAWPSETEWLSLPDLAVLQSVNYARSREEYRAVFQGIQLEASPSRLRAVASDGFRLASAWLTQSCPQTLKRVVPGDSWVELGRLARGQPVRLAFGADTLYAEFGAMRYATRLMDGEFPDVSRVIPQNFVCNLEVSRLALIETLKRLRFLASRDNQRIDWAVQPALLSLSSEGDRGKAHEELSAVASDSLNLSVNAQYMLEALAQMTTERVTIDFSGPTTPFIVRGTDMQAVVVPLRT